jgi:uncharacterized protein (TIGR02246 family)
VVDALLDAIVDAWNRHDGKSLALTFAPDADFYNLRGKKLTGRDTVEKFFTRAFAANLGTSQLAQPEPNVRFVGEAAAAVDLLATLKGAKDPKGQPRADRRMLLDGTAGQNPQGGWWLVVLHLRALPPEGDDKSGDAPDPA